MGVIKMLSFQSLFLFTLLAISTFALDQCPQDVQTIDVLDPEKYLGNWYTVYARNVGIEGDINEWTQICGFAYQPNPERDPGKLIVQFPQGKPGDYWILGTDYESFAVVYSCFEFNGMVSLQAWIITRDPQPELETIEKGLDILVANGIDVTDFVVFPHDNCDYSSIDDSACKPFDE